MAMEDDRDKAVRQISVIGAVFVGGATLAAGAFTGNAFRGLWVGLLTGVAVWLVARLGAWLWPK